MKKKLFLAVCAVTCATAMTVGFTACNNDNGGMSAEDAAAKIATFTTSPNTVNATFKQTYKLAVDDERENFKSFEKDIADTVTVQADFTAGNLYYYAKKVAKDNSVTEQLVVKEDSTYYFLTTTTAKQSLADEAAAKTKINELMTSVTKQTSGYIDSEAFVYNADWVHTYLLLDSGTLNGTEKSSFTYSYEAAESDGLKVGIDMNYVGYYGDAGVFEFGTDATHTGARADIVTNDKGYITSFSQTLNNHLDMNITNPAIPLDLTGTRSLVATYNGTVEKKAATDIEQDIPTTSNIVAPTVDHATIATYDFKNGDYSTLGTPSSTVTAGNFVAVKVTCDEGYVVASVKVNGNDTQFINGYYCLMTPAEAGTKYNVAVVVTKEGEEAPTTGTIVAPTVEHATITTYDFKNGDFTTLQTPSAIVTPGNFVAIKVVCDNGYIVDSVKVNDTATQFINGYYCLMQSATAGTTYNVAVIVKEKVTVNVNEVEGATVNVKGLTYIPGNLQYRDGAVVVGEFVCVQVIPDANHANYTISVSVNDISTPDKVVDFTSQWDGDGNLYCFMQSATAGTTYTVVVTLTQA